MNRYDEESAGFPEPPLGDDLPPVQPPSAGFIIQLFVFPALIVMGVVGIWWAFGMIAAGETDWHKLLQDLQSQNMHVRKRAMYGMAQLLEQDGRRGDQGSHLNQNREIAATLTEQLTAELRRNGSSDDDLVIQQFLTRALGLMEPFDITAPALSLALQPQFDAEVRKSAVISISLAAGRAFEAHQKNESPALVEALVELSKDTQPVMRQSAAFALGLFDSPEAAHQLEVLLGDGDFLTRVNAAIGLARHGSTEEYPVLVESLQSEIAADSSEKKTSSRELAVDERFRVVFNVVKAVGELARKFDPEQRKELISLVQELANQHAEVRIRVEAKSALVSLKAAEAGV